MKIEDRMKNIDYQLRHFVEIATHKSLSDAAISLGVTQSALSKQLHEIELAVGHHVFRRHRRGIELTEHGKVLWRAVQTAYKLVDTTVGYLRATSSHNAVETLRVATVHGLADAAVNGLLIAVLGQRVDIDLIMTAGSAIDVLKLVETGMADFCVVDDTLSIPCNRAAGDARRTARDAAQEMPERLG
jgi:DNA-binding transcriptional LysR family regulator